MTRAVVRLAALVVVGASVAGVAGAARAQTKAQQVTLIGDSVADAIVQTSGAVAEARREVSLNLQVAPCRRTAGQSCPYNGVRPPNVIDLVQSLGPALGPNVVVAVGYNDDEGTFAQSVDDALTALEGAGVKRVFWLTLRAARHPYLTMNAALEAAAERHPDLTLVDWNVYSRSHLDWFQSDGIHLSGSGANAMATLIHKALVGAGVAAPDVRVKTARLPVARRGAAYSARLVGAAGIAPYRWSLLQRAPAGVHLEASGLVEGRPRAAAGAYAFAVRITDATGTSSTRRLTLHIAT
ncbi:MAG TPA: putative Ig domain-containing protein [Gaiellaceae bacterium]